MYALSIFSSSIMVLHADNREIREDLSAEERQQGLSRTEADPPNSCLPQLGMLDFDKNLDRTKLCPRKGLLLVNPFMPIATKKALI